jgi:DNA-directed RNA polymerase specialized sigma24 family protein
MRASLDEIERIYRDRGADFYRFAYARTGDAQAARDAVQEGFANAVRSRHRYRGSGPSTRGSRAA